MPSDLLFNSQLLRSVQSPVRLAAADGPIITTRTKPLVPSLNKPAPARLGRPVLDS